MYMYMYMYMYMGRNLRIYVLRFFPCIDIWALQKIYIIYIYMYIHFGWFQNWKLCVLHISSCIHIWADKRQQSLVEHKIEDSIAYLQLLSKVFTFFLLQKNIIFRGVQIEDLKHSLDIWSKVFNLGPYKNMVGHKVEDFSGSISCSVFTHLGPAKNRT